MVKMAAFQMYLLFHVMIVIPSCFYASNRLCSDRPVPGIHWYPMSRCSYRYRGYRNYAKLTESSDIVGWIRREVTIA
jgi:hypothetical protein